MGHSFSPSQSHQVSTFFVFGSSFPFLNSGKGFCFSGIRKEMDDPENYSIDLDLSEYVEKLDQKDAKQIITKIQRDKLYIMDLNYSSHAVCNIFTSLVWQCNYCGNTYILWNGSWYYVEHSFLNEVCRYIDSIPITLQTFPNCQHGEREGSYNQRVADGNEQ